MSRDNSTNKLAKRIADINSRLKEESIKQSGKGIIIDNEEYEISAYRQDNYLEELFNARTSDMRLYNFVWLYLQFKEDAKFEEFN